MVQSLAETGACLVAEIGSVHYTAHKLQPAQFDSAYAEKNTTPTCYLNYQENSISIPKDDLLI